MDNLSNVYTATPSRGLITDLDASLISKDFWTYARNSNHNTHQGNLQFLTNEPSNKFIADLPYDCIGFVKLIGGRYALFLTDNTHSEIGIFDTNLGTYTKVVNADCLNFNTSYLVNAVSKENFDCSETIYWTDKLNPRRKLNLAKIPFTFTLGDDECQTKKFTDKLDCNEILMTPKLTVPKVTVTLGSGGELGNGTYQIGVAYTVNKQRLTDYYSITTPQAIWSHFNLGQSLEIQIDNLDHEFDQYEIVVIYTQKQTTTAKIIGYFSTSVSHIQLVNVNRPEYIPITLEEVITARPKYYTADQVVNNDQFLIWGGVSTRPELNYQKQAMQINAKWIMYQVPSDYYVNGGNKVGYSRRERYAFGIQWLFDTGEWSSTFHIPGRKSKETEVTPASGADVYEKTTSKSDDPNLNKIRSFEVYDTSKKTKVINNRNRLPEFKIAEGKMGYWESSDTYPDNKIMFGDDACTPIRHHAFPGEAVAPRYQGGGLFVNILGVKFENVEHPKNSKGKYIDGIVGYRIVRGDRQGNRSVITKGMFSNVRSYTEGLDQGGTSEEVLYPNYPYNSLLTDPFLSQSQTSHRGGERGYRGLSNYKKDQFNFYGPETMFNNVALGEEVLFETQEQGFVTGNFENVWLHPRGKVVSNSVFWLAVMVGAIDGVLSVFGKRCVTQLKDGITEIVNVGPPPSAVTITAVGMTLVQQCETLVNGLTFGQIFQLPIIEAAAKTALKILQTAAAIGMAAFYAFNTANQLIKDILAFMAYKKYALQYNSHALFKVAKPQEKDNLRRKLNYYQYLYDGINTINSVKFNNFKREKSVYLNLSGDILEPADVVDNSLQSIATAGLCDTPHKSYKSTAVMYYGMIRRKVQDQYGQIDSIIYLDTGFIDQTLITKVAEGSEDKIYTADLVFGGDTFISKFTMAKKMQFFSQNLANADFPDGTEYDYSLYRNVAFPRFWLNTEHYDMSQVVVVGSSPGKLPDAKYNLDCGSTGGSNQLLNLESAPGYFYLFNTGVMDFFVESDLNLDYRDWKGEFQNFYSRSQTNLSFLYRSDHISTPEEFIYDSSYSKQLEENAIFQQRIDYDPTLDMTCFSYYKNRVIYSQPAFLDQKSDNWLIYLVNNFYDFPLSEFGGLTGMHSVDNQQILFTFDKSAPYITIGRDEIQTTGGVKVTIGDAGLFAREPRPIAYTDYAYGNSQSRWAFVNTQFGSIYPSQRQGRIFNWKGQLDEISRQGMHWWFKQYLPSRLLESFPSYFGGDNPVVGVGLTSGWDNTDEKYYLSKRDFQLKPIYKDFVKYNEKTKGLEYIDPNSGGVLAKITLGDPIYFDDASWTISYSPKDQSFISFHDWQPDWILPAEKHFFTIKFRAIYLHNSRCDSYCNFYFQDYPWEIEYLVNNGGTVMALNSIEYIIESGIYYDNCGYFHQVLDGNFDRLVVHNLEQSSGYLGLTLQNRNRMSELLDYPQLLPDNGGWLVSYSKVEQKTRINQFEDLTKDRGSRSHKNYPLWTMSPNGYIKTVQSQSINLIKNQFERKKFRNLWHKIYLSKLVSGNRKMIFKFSNVKSTISPR